jgi:spermidine/putrescine transport system permease protein
MTATTAGGASVPPAAPSGFARLRRWLGGVWPFAPITVMLVGLFMVPLVIVIVYSFWTTDNLNIIPKWTLANYARFFTSDGVYLQTFGKTVLMAGLVTAAALGLAVPFAYFLVRYVGARWQRIVLLAVIIPFWTSYLLRIYAWQAILGEKGALNSFLMWTGVIHEPSRLFVYNNTAVFIVLVYLYFPFAALAVYSSLEKFDFNLFKAAQDLGARPDQAFRHILVPAVRPGLITGFIFVFVPVLGEYLAPTLVGGTEGVLISNSIVRFFGGLQYPAGAAIALVIALFVVVLLVIFRKYLSIEDVVARA